MSLGHIDKYKVIRETQLGYMLEKDNQEYFLHHNECNGKFPQIDDEIEAFIYIDKKGREAATLFPPKITIDNMGIGEVVAVNNDSGLFVNIGISKDILLSKDDLPLNRRIWPVVGDKVFAIMKIRSKKLVLKLASKNDILHKRCDVNYAEGEKVDAYVYRITDDGINLVTEDYQVIFVYKNNYRGVYHLGQKVNAKIIKKNFEDYSATLIEQKELQIQDDKEIILQYLKDNNGVMMITENSSPELISHVLHMSKSAFKKALGGLLKNNLIEIEEDKIILID